jgi:hypothetical protein
MKVPPTRPKIVWKTVAVTGDDPVRFAQALEASLQEMTDGDYNIVNQVVRGSAIIITGHRVEAVDGVASPPRAHAPNERRRIVAAPQASGATTEEILYHYIEEGKQKQKAFPALVDALRAVKAHMDAPPVPDVAPVCPVSIVTVSMTKFELPMFSTLLKAFSEDLRDEDKPLG